MLRCPQTVPRSVLTRFENVMAQARLGTIYDIDLSWCDMTRYKARLEDFVQRIYSEFKDCGTSFAVAWDPSKISIDDHVHASDTLYFIEGRIEGARLNEFAFRIYFRYGFEPGFRSSVHESREKYYGTYVQWIGDEKAWPMSEAFSDLFRDVLANTVDEQGARGFRSEDHQDFRGFLRRIESAFRTATQNVLFSSLAFFAIPKHLAHDVFFKCNPIETPSAALCVDGSDVTVHGFMYNYFQQHYHGDSLRGAPSLRRRFVH
jgi:hypothetical protein